MRPAFFVYPFEPIGSPANAMVPASNNDVANTTPSFMTGFLLFTRRYFLNVYARCGFIEPCLPTVSRIVPTGAEWPYEIKHDGFRFIR
jgi:hypothetical protein